MTNRDYIIRQREEIYDEMCKVLTDYENIEGDMVTEWDLYQMLVRIQKNWETVITVKED